MKDEFDDIDFDAVAGGFEAPGDESAPVREIFGSPKNIQAHGAPSRTTGANDGPIRYYFFPTWRSQCLNLLAFFALCLVGIVGSRAIPHTVMAGSLFSFGDTSYFLHLPLLCLPAGAMLVRILIHIYDAKYIIDEHGVEAQIGLVSLNLRQPRLRWEDIRGVEPNQTIWERILGIGTVLVGSAMTQEVEVVMSGVANPRAIQLLIGGERDKRLKELQSQGHGLRQAIGVLGD
jgi:hypothetical protein